MGKDIAIAAFFAIAIFVAIFGASFYLAAASCASQAAKMGFRYEWGAMQGCMIEPQPGKWVPLRNYRVL